jgi:hypothetical protein
MEKPHEVISDIEILPAHFPIPGMGMIPVNAFVIRAQEPVLVDTGMGIDGQEFLKALESVIDPHDLKWVWLTHDDADHTGSLQKVLEAAPHARLAVNSLAALRLSTARALPMNRVYWLNPGESISAGDRTLTAVKPPLFDNPTTIGLYDSKSEAYFSADCCGAIIPSPADTVDEISERDLTQGMIAWASADSPWVHMIDPGVFGRTLDEIRKLAPKLVLSAHLPPARGKTETLFKILADVPASVPFVAPNQTVLQQILAQTESITGPT